MTDNFLKYEIEAAARVASRRRRIVLAIGVFIVLAGSVSVFAWRQGRTDTYSKAEVLSTSSEDRSFDKTENRSQDEPEEQTEQTAPVASPQSSSTQPTAPQTYTPSPQGVDKAAFVSDGKTVVAAYNRIVGLVTFGSSMSDDEKAARIKQAVELDKQFTNKVTDLRGHLVWADVKSGPYMEATELAESGVSKISVGLTFMNYWADNRSRTSDLQSGLGGVTKGSDILLRFSQKLNGL